MNTKELTEEFNNVENTDSYCTQILKAIHEAIQGKKTVNVTCNGKTEKMSTDKIAEDIEFGQKHPSVFLALLDTDSISYGQTIIYDKSEFASRSNVINDLAMEITSFEEQRNEHSLDRGTVYYRDILKNQDIKEIAKVLNKIKYRNLDLDAISSEEALGILKGAIDINAKEDPMNTIKCAELQNSLKAYCPKAVRNEVMLLSAQTNEKLRQIANGKMEQGQSNSKKTLSDVEKIASNNKSEVNTKQKENTKTM